MQLDLTMRKFTSQLYRVDLPQVVFLSDEVGQTSDESREETTCLACIDSYLICILLAEIPAMASWMRCK